ncbi:MAG: type II toxin-antitoxin system VapB family antitoxin [Hyphomonas sp.]
MALSIKTEEADRLARLLAELTGETMTEAVTKALRERVERLRGGQAAHERIAQGVAYAESIRHRYDWKNPISQKEWDEAGGDAFDQEAG